MKKFNTILAIAAVALTSVFGFTSCEKSDPFVDPNGPGYRPQDPTPVEELMLNGELEYDYSAHALSMVSVSYEVTDFDGNVDSFEITQPGKVTKKIGSTKNLNAAAKVKVVVTPKGGLNEEMVECEVNFISVVKGYISSNINEDIPLSINNPGNLINMNYGKTRLVPQSFANKAAGTYEITIKK